MALPTIRPMLPTDVDSATDLILSHDWGVRRDWLAYAADASACVPMVATDHRSIVATGVGTANGPVGWVGSIFVAPETRGHGLGRAVTQAIIDALEALGCRTLCLVATSEGRHLYERMGFEVQTRYRILEASGLAADEPGADAGPTVRPFEPGDLDALFALDAEATGEDRRHALLAFANPATTKVLAGSDGRARGFVCRPPWGGGATIARSIDDALAIADARRRAAGPDGKVRVGILRDNEAGHEALLAAGWRPSWSAPRMIRGAQIDWRPDWIWGQFNHAMG
jgi:GNAT superfamily N-acetyltransferase